METAVKEQLLDRLRDYLDQDSVDLPAPDAAEAPDLFSLLAELAALKNEVKIESRQVKTALDEFRSLFDTLQQSNTRLDNELTRQREQAAKTRQETERELLMELLDLRDRIHAGQTSMSRYQPGWLARRTGVEDILSRFSEGQDMNLRRFDEILARRGVRPLETLGEYFDPHTMHAVETAHEPGQDEGQILTEIRTGFMQHEQLLRPAEVIVNKKANSHE